MRHIITVAWILSASVAHADTKTVSWFLAHPDARAKVNAMCRDNPGEARHVPNCTNALEATTQASIAKMGKGTDPSTNGKTLIEMCDQMSGLFQAANRCGAYANR
jgi:hypothetical protein